MSKTNGKITRYGWHFIRNEKTLGFDDNRRVRVNQRIEYKKKCGCDGVEVCRQGMHASPTITDAYDCWHSLIVGGHTTAKLDDSWLCRVKVEGSGYNYRYSESDPRKFVGTHRTILGMISFGDLNKSLGYVYLDDLVDSKTYARRQAMKRIFEKMAVRNRKNKVASKLK